MTQEITVAVSPSRAPCAAHIVLLMFDKFTGGVLMREVIKDICCNYGERVYSKSICHSKQERACTTYAWLAPQKIQ